MANFIPQLSDCWAKTDPTSGLLALTVRDHCLIVGAVAEVLYQHLPPIVRRNLPPAAMSLAALHDVGKLTIGFQLKCEWWKDWARLQGIAVNRLAGSCRNHSAISEIDLTLAQLYGPVPVAYPAIHRAFLSAPPLDSTAALALARAQVPSAQLEAAMREPWIDQLIAANIADWVSFSGKNRKLPKLLISGKRILHGLPSGEADFIRVMESELGL